MRGLAAIGVSLLLAGCAGVSVVPPELKDKVDEKVSFLQVKASPLSYKGRSDRGGWDGLDGQTVEAGRDEDRNP